MEHHGGVEDNAKSCVRHVKNVTLRNNPKISQHVTLLHRKNRAAGGLDGSYVAKWDKAVYGLLVRVEHVVQLHEQGVEREAEAGQANQEELHVNRAR